MHDSKQAKPTRILSNALQYAMLLYNLSQSHPVAIRS
jgi:hypothetical protein